MSSIIAIILFNNQSRKKILATCKPFFKALGVVYFGHTRAFQDKSATAIITEPSLIDYWVNQKFPIPSMLPPGFYLVSLMDEVMPEHQRKELRKLFGLDHVLFYVDKDAAYTDIYMIAAKPKDQFVS